MAPASFNEDTKNEALHVENAFYDRGYIPDTPEEKRLVRKIDIRMLPMLWVMYILNYIDRTNIGNARIAGMAVDLSMSSTDYSTALSIFFVGYLLNEIPSNMLLSRSKPSYFLPAIMFAWGCLTIAAVGVNSTGGLIALRFFLGFIEAGFFPGVMFLMSCWYKPFELAKRLAIFYTASLMSGAFGGLLAGAITGNMDGVGGVRGWKWLFVVEGIATVVLAVLAVFVLPDFPHSTNGLTDEERALAQLRLITAASSQPTLSHKQAFVQAMKDKKTWLLTAGYMGITSAGTISYFFPTLMLTLGYRGTQANLMTAPIYACCLFICICVGFSSDRFNEKPYHIAGCTIVSAVCFLVTAFVSNSAVRYTFIVFGGAGIWSATPLFLSYALQNFDNREQRAVSIATINGLGNLASVYGSYIWPANTGPKFIQGFCCTTAFILVGGAATMFNRWMVGDLSIRTAEQDAADEHARNTSAPHPDQKMDKGELDV